LIKPIQGQGKAFFFAKKKQKTLFRLSRPWRLARGHSSPNSQPIQIKSFLLPFFKKEALAYLPGHREGRPHTSVADIA
jgi:hypothetical protein